jgi:hypothetical protein
MEGPGAGGRQARRPMTGLLIVLVCWAQFQPIGPSTAPYPLGNVSLASDVSTAAVFPHPPSPPTPAPVYSPPAPVYRQPTQVYRQPTPVYRQPAPVYRQPTPVRPQPVPVPVPVYPRPAPVYPHPRPAYPQPWPAPDHPVPVYSYPIPDHRRPVPAPVHPGPSPVHPAPVRQRPVPAPVQPPQVPALVVPRVLGYGLYLAEQILTEHGLTVGTVLARPSTATAGTVIQTSPSAYSQVPPGSRIDLVVAMPQ